MLVGLANTVNPLQRLVVTKVARSVGERCMKNSAERLKLWLLDDVTPVSHGSQTNGRTYAHI